MVFHDLIMIPVDFAWSREKEGIERSRAVGRAGRSRVKVVKVGWMKDGCWMLDG